MSRVTSSSAGGSNPSVGIDGNTAPGYATEIGGINPAGNLVGLLTDSNGALIVNTSSVSGVEFLNLIYGEIASVPVGVETTINSYTAPVGKHSYLLMVQASGQNTGQFNLYSGGNLIDKQYLTYTAFDVMFDYRTDSDAYPGYLVTPGTTILVTAINSSQSLSSAAYNARISVLEITP